MCEVKAKGTFRGHELNDIPVANPGSWFGKTWLLEIGGSYDPTFLVVEADTASDAIDELAESKYGHLITVDEADLGDYPEDERQYGADDQVLDLDWLLIHGQEGCDCPFPCRYFGDGLPKEGMKPTDFYCRDDDDLGTPPTVTEEEETHVQNPHR